MYNGTTKNSSNVTQCYEGRYIQSGVGKVEIHKIYKIRKKGQQ